MDDRKGGHPTGMSVRRKRDFVIIRNLFSTRHHEQNLQGHRQPNSRTLHGPQWKSAFVYQKKSGTLSSGTKKFAKKNKHPLMRLIKHPDRQALLLRVGSNLFFLPDIYPPHEMSWVRMMYWSACQYTWTETIYILFINKGRITGDLNIRTTGMAIWKKG